MGSSRRFYPTRGAVGRDLRAPSQRIQRGLSAEDALHGYKSLSEVERVFRCLKGMDLVGPMRLNFSRPHVRRTSPHCLCERSSNHKGSDALIGD